MSASAEKVSVNVPGEHAAKIDRIENRKQSREAVYEIVRRLISL